MKRRKPLTEADQLDVVAYRGAQLLLLEHIRVHGGDPDNPTEAQVLAAVDWMLAGVRVKMSVDEIKRDHERLERLHKRSRQ